MIDDERLPALINEALLSVIKQDIDEKSRRLASATVIDHEASILFASLVGDFECPVRRLTQDVAQFESDVITFRAHPQSVSTGITTDIEKLRQAFETISTNICSFRISAKHVMSLTSFIVVSDEQRTLMQHRLGELSDTAGRLSAIAFHSVSELVPRIGESLRGAFEASVDWKLDQLDYLWRLHSSTGEADILQLQASNLLAAVVSDFSHVVHYFTKQLNALESNASPFYAEQLLETEPVVEVLGKHRSEDDAAAAVAAQTRLNLAEEKGSEHIERIQKTFDWLLTHAHEYRTLAKRVVDIVSWFASGSDEKKAIERVLASLTEVHRHLLLRSTLFITKQPPIVVRKESDLGFDQTIADFLDTPTRGEGEQHPKYRAFLVREMEGRALYDAWKQGLIQPAIRQVIEPLSLTPSAKVRSQVVTSCKSNSFHEELVLPLNGTAIWLANIDVLKQSPLENDARQQKLTLKLTSFVDDDRRWGNRKRRWLPRKRTRTSSSDSTGDANETASAATKRYCVIYAKAISTPLLQYKGISFADVFDSQPTYRFAFSAPFCITIHSSHLPCAVVAASWARLCADWPLDRFDFPVKAPIDAVQLVQRVAFKHLTRCKHHPHTRELDDDDLAQIEVKLLADLKRDGAPVNTQLKRSQHMVAWPAFTGFHKKSGQMCSFWNWFEKTAALIAKDDTVNMLFTSRTIFVATPKTQRRVPLEERRKRVLKAIDEHRIGGCTKEQLHQRQLKEPSMLNPNSFGLFISLNTAGGISLTCLTDGVLKCIEPFDLARFQKDCLLKYIAANYDELPVCPSGGAASEHECNVKLRAMLSDYLSTASEPAQGGSTNHGYVNARLDIQHLFERALSL